MHWNYAKTGLALTARGCSIRILGPYIIIFAFARLQLRSGTCLIHQTQMTCRDLFEISIYIANRYWEANRIEPFPPVSIPWGLCYKNYYREF